MEKITAFRTYGGTICTDEKQAAKIEAQEILKDNIFGILMSTQEDYPMSNEQCSYVADAFMDTMTNNPDRYITLLTATK